MLATAVQLSPESESWRTAMNRNSAHHDSERLDQDELRALANSLQIKDYTSIIRRLKL
jgi:hypothetical protein